MGSNEADGEFPYRITVICGARRTGTTLMNQILCSDPGTHAQIGEARLIAKMLELCGWADDNYDNVVQWYFEDRERYDAYFGMLLSTLLDHTVAALKPGNRIVLKAPNFAPLVGLTLDRLPNSDMLVCVRSPFDQVTSDFEVGLRQVEQGMKKQNRSTRRDFAGFARTYMSQYAPILAAREQYSDRLHFIRYEDVVHDTAATVARIETLFGVDLSAYDPGAEWKNFANREALEKMPAYVKQYGSPLDSSRTGRYRDVLSADEIKTVGRICAPMIDAFYPEYADAGEATGQMSTAIHLKTVFDAMQPDRFGIHDPLLRLHVASWHRNVRKSTGLTVTMIGDAPDGVPEFLSDLGAKREQVTEWHPLHHRSPIYNKHLSKPGPDLAERIYLTDNDTVYLTDIDALLAVPEGAVGVSLPDNRRVSPELWEEMRRDIGLEVLEFDWIPNKEKATAFVEGRPAVWEKYGYFNGGAILFPGGPNFWDLWERTTYRISSYLEGRGLHDRKDAGSDQLSLTTAVAIHGQWAFLPASYNVRPFQFWLDEAVDDPVDQIHMVNFSRAARHLRDPEACTLPALLETYWDLFYRENIHPAAAEKAEAVLKDCLSIVEEYNL